MPSLTELASPEDPRLALILRANLALVSINDRLVDHWSAHARAKDLTGAQAKVLLALSAREAVTMRALARRLSYDASNLTSVVDRLEDRGLVRRGHDQSDRRSRPVQLTDTGQSLRDTFWNDLTHDAGPLAALDTDQLDALCRTLVALEDPTTAG
jgi:DNA-binding MarR family transcriptional regulator